MQCLKERYFQATPYNRHSHAYTLRYVNAQRTSRHVAIRLAVEYRNRGAPKRCVRPVSVVIWPET
jgi:hypothetical protein